MKPNLKKQIESSQKANEYVNSLVPKDNDVIGAVIEQIKDSEYSPNYVKYHDGEKWVEVRKDKPQSLETVFTKQQLIDLGISNNIPEYMKKIKRRKLMFIILKYTIAGIIAIIVYNLKYN